MLALQKSAVATPLMVPLIAITVLFNSYIRKQHIRVAQYLPSRECMKVDVVHNGQGFDLSFTKDAYLQKELSVKAKYPENLSDERARELGLIEPYDSVGAVEPQKDHETSRAPTVLPQLTLPEEYRRIRS